MLVFKFMKQKLLNIKQQLFFKNQQNKNISRKLGQTFGTIEKPLMNEISWRKI
jgi:hypothetical protein